MNSEWWQKVAGMTRKQLLDAYVLESEAHEDTQAEVESFKGLAARRESVLVAFSRSEADLSMKRMGLPLYGKTIIFTSVPLNNILRGRNLKEDDLLMIPGWGRGDYAEEIRNELGRCGVKWQNCRYAPSPETDRAEGPSNWGRTESAIVDDTLATLGKLLDRTLERTAEDPIEAVVAGQNARTWGVIGTHG